MAQNPTNTVLLLGGFINQDGSSVSGLPSEQLISDLHIQKAFVSGSGFTPEVGLTEVHITEARLKNKAIQSAKEVIALVDASKFGNVDLTPFARLEKITHLFTDCNLSSEWVTRLKQTCLVFTICDEDHVTHYNPVD